MLKETNINVLFTEDISCILVIFVYCYLAPSSSGDYTVTTDKVITLSLAWLRE